MTPPRVRRPDAHGKDRGVQLEMPGGTEPALPGGSGPHGPANPSGAARGSARPGGPPAPAAAAPESDEKRRQRRVQRTDSRKALSKSRQMMRDSDAAMQTSRGRIERGSPTTARHRPPVILEFGPRDYAVLAWFRDEDGEAVYKVVQRGIKAASTAGVLARKLQSEAASR